MLGAGVAVVEAVLGSDPARAAASALLMAGCGVAAVRRGQTIGYWAFVAALEAAVWLPDSDLASV